MIDVTVEIANQIAKIIPEAIIYRENQEQGFSESSFYIYEIMADSKDELMQQQMRKHLYCVMWFPDSQNDEFGIKEQCENMRSLLFNEFNFIENLSLKVMDKEARIVDGTLQLTFKVRYRMRQVNENSKLTQLEQQGGLKYG
ncbi:phage tail terminator family protein [Enterococcus sp. DIV1420a]|uniref:phage tail terminator family protein n=1 Tax=Enterococcus sp. DIV1420a TaxID=2774672 RepID=UPI003F248331